MKIHSLYITNYKGIGLLELELNKKSTVFFGENGTGKSSLLQAILLIYSQIIYRLLEKRKPPSLVIDDITFGEQFTKIDIDLEIDDKRYQYYRKIQRKISKKTHDLEQLHDLIKYLIELIQDPNKGTPVFINYGVHRAVFEVPLRIRNKHEEFNKFVAYENCLEPRTDFKTFFEWYRNQEDIENEQLRDDKDYVDIPLKSVQEAIYKFLPEISNLKIRRKPRLQMVVTKNGTTLRINQLSDGEKCLLALVGDIARRLAIASPNSKEPLNESGLVLIDEVELHLHPKWQRQIVPRLQSTFPNVQFIITTHSPQVLGEIKGMNIFKLSRYDSKELKVEEIGDLYGKDTNYILEQYMDTRKENSIISDNIKKLFALIDNDDLIKADELYNSLSNILTPRHAELVKAEILIRRKKKKI